MFNNLEIKKNLLALLIVFLVLYQSFIPSLVIAQEISETPIPNQTTIDNNSVVDNSTDNVANTGNNTINPTPTGILEDNQLKAQNSTPAGDIVDNPITTSSEDKESSNSANIDITNDGEINNNSGNLADSGSNVVNEATPSACINGQYQDSEIQKSCSGGDENIETGNVLSEVAVENDVNTTQIASKVEMQTLNLFLDQNSNINLSDPFTIAAKVIPQYPDDSTINLNVLNVNNYAYLNNNVVSFANSGNNTINSYSEGQKAEIKTGDAYSLVSVLNKVNLVLIGSTLHIITINIFGNLSGNIILPNFNQTNSSCNTCGVSLLASNSATVNNNVDSTAVSGQNTINGGGNIDTGNVNSIQNVVNIVNSSYVGMSIQALFINLFGTWNGSFIGWGDVGPQDGGSSLILFQTGPVVANGDCSLCSFSAININNTAIVNNDINSTANTGGNVINGNGEIFTGNAVSAVSLLNFINTNFINTFGFFGFINIFGNWNGDIGGEAEFAAQNNEDHDNSASQSKSTNTQQEPGGALSVTNSNNVGDYVLPGDTVTFSVKAKNTGTGKIYGAKVDLYLVKDGQAGGGSTFDLGDIDPGVTKTLTTGFVLSKNIKGGTYVARSNVYGNVGPDNSQISVTADSSFNIYAPKIIAISSASTHIQQPQNSVLGTQTPNIGKNRAESQNLALYALFGVVISYLVIRGMKKRKSFREIWIKSGSVKEKLTALRMLFL